jgi:hypothetical protein
MADRVLFIGWGEGVPGREERGLEVFSEALGLLGRKQQEGQIDSFDTVLFEPNGELGGFILVHGTAAQISALRADEEFRRNSADATLIIQKLTHIEGYTNEAIAGEIAIYQEAIAKTPQRA